MDEILERALIAFLPAGGFALAALLVARARPATAAVLEPVAIAVPVLWTYAVISGHWLPDPRRSFVHWIPLGVAAALVTAVATRRSRFALRLAILVVSTLLFYFLLRKILGFEPYASWTTAKRVALSLGLVIVISETAGRPFGFEIGRPLRAWEVYLAHGITAAAMVPCLLLAGSSQWAQIAGGPGLVCAAGVIAAVLSRGRDPEVDPWSLWILSVAFWALPVFLYFSLDGLGFWAALILVFAPPWAMHALAVADGEQEDGWKWHALVYGGLLGFAALAVGLTAWPDGEAAETDGPDYSDYGY